MTSLFKPFELKNVMLRNRIVAAPMCMYSVENGLVGEWHHAHLEQLAMGGAGMVTVEMTAVSPEGRITWADAGLWNDEQAAALEPIAAAIKATGSVPAIQLGHAGRKASANRPWEGDDQIADDAPRGWPVIGPSPVAFGSPNVWKLPREMSLEDIRRVQGDFAKAARRAREAGFEWLELHFAHGFLAHSFLSPYSNRRTDAYGGSFENRARFVLETFEAVRRVWPAELPLSVRLGVVEYDGRDEETIAESVELIRRLKSNGLDFVSVSVGFSKPDASVPWHSPAFMAPLVERIRRETDLPAAVAWGLGDPHVADEVLRKGQADLVKIGRALLANPHWPYEAAKALGVERPSWATLPAPYAHWLESYRPVGAADVDNADA
ncbi:NADH:flavin oxidoreductase/NADH oxidase [Sphingomonas sp. BK580]|uniref:NADH:flavin oxidoreductase/NADH oxidase n=1 Tax=Sphingomonas sp. BK580 TaxID=2586972 RepID=UPI001615C640|nr:NADH:flavin oxidoreductase/NADH oxidase [Sphingomonas sp. BK580]MBB3695260.1 2,4-dienoyl-CoA reductase-like NADH-dependent reductase (Old Yellow Enzyme family) [Sphingomonas sp. BK580]